MRPGQRYRELSHVKKNITCNLRRTVACYVHGAPALWFQSIKLLAVTTAGPKFRPPGYECDLLYLGCLAALVLGQSGPLSIDDLIRKRREGRKSWLVLRQDGSAVLLIPRDDEVRHPQQGAAFVTFRQVGDQGSGEVGVAIGGGECVVDGAVPLKDRQNLRVGDPLK
jgi:hypothetical protein